LVVEDEKTKLLNELRDALSLVRRVEDGLSKCVVDTESLKGVHYAIGAEKGLGTSAKNALWQEVVAALNRRKCVSNELADELIKDEWRI